MTLDLPQPVAAYFTTDRSDSEAVGGRRLDEDRRWIRNWSRKRRGGQPLRAIPAPAAVLGNLSYVLHCSCTAHLRPGK